MPQTKTKNESIELATLHVWTDFEAFIKMLAKEHTVANMGMDLVDFVGRGYVPKPEDVVNYAFNGLMNDMESDEMADGVQDEYRSWLKQGRKDAERVRKAGLPLTLANAALSFENKGPFAKKVRKTA